MKTENNPDKQSGWENNAGDGYGYYYGPGNSSGFSDCTGYGFGYANGDANSNNAGHG